MAPCWLENNQKYSEQAYRDSLYSHAGIQSFKNIAAGPVKKAFGFPHLSVLAIVGILAVWAINFIFINNLRTTLIPFTGMFVPDSLILTAVIVVIWFFLRHWLKSHDNIAAETESKYSSDRG